jgi:hypothetical protein
MLTSAQNYQSSLPSWGSGAGPAATSTSTAPPTVPPQGFFGAYAYSHDVSTTFHSRYGSLAALDAQLIAKRESLLQQVRAAGPSRVCVHDAM